jgi:hypothetical protein
MMIVVPTFVQMANRVKTVEVDQFVDARQATKKTQELGLVLVSNYSFTC